MTFLKLALITVLLSTSTAFAGFILTPEEKVADFEQLNAQIDSHYGPKIYKQEVMRLDLVELRTKYREAILNSKTNSEFYYLMVQFVAEFKDGHFGIAVPTDMIAALPIFTDLIAGKVLIDNIDRKVLPEAQFPYVKGDEIVAIDGVATSDVLNEMSKNVVSGKDNSIRRKTAMALFVRSGKIFPMPKNEIVKISIRRGLSNVIETAELEWKITGTPLDEMTTPLMQPLFHAKATQAKNYDTLSSKDTWIDLLGAKRLERYFQCSGTTRTAIPEGATVLMEEPFVAYYHPTAKGNIGYLRIPHYMPPIKPGTTENDYDGYFKRYEWVISEFEKNTVGMVIDQDHNCGGSVDYLHRIVSLFMQTPFQPLQFELRASKAEYIGFKAWAAETSPDTIEGKSIQKVIDLILKSWKENLYLTPKTSIDGQEWIYPNPIRYTKPVVMLIDEMSGSGGDAFPSLMKGLGRATLIGTSTMGLGGHVTATPSLNNSGMVIRMTQSLFYRPDGVPVENNGAVPDVNYSPTRDDFMYGYKNYQEFYLYVLFSKLGN